MISRLIHLFGSVGMPSIFEDADSTISSSFFDFPYDQGRTDHFESSSPKTDSTGRKKKDFSTKTVMDNQQHQISSTNLEMIPNNSGNMQAAFVSGLADSSASAVQFMPLGAIAPQGSTTQSMQPVHPMQLAQPIGFMQPAPPLTGKNLPPILQKNYRLRTQGNSLKPRPAVVDNEESASTPAASSPLSTTSSSMMAVDAFRSTSSSAGSPYSITEMPKRDAHIASEQRRRAVMKDAYDRLQELLPTSEYRKPSKANLLSAAVNYIMSLQRKITVVGQQNERLRLENHMLMMQIGGQGAANGPSTESQGRIAPALIQPNMVPQHPQ